MAVVSLEKSPPPDMEEVPEFQEEFAEISETYNSFPKDFEGFKSVLEAKLPGYPNGTFPISGLGGGVIYPVYKVKRFRCECINLALSFITIALARSCYRLGFNL